MIALSDNLLASGASLTFHYTHPARSVAMQIALAAKLDFTHPSPQQLMRASVFFTGFVAGGVAVDLSEPPANNPPQFRATDVTEIRGELIADNCELMAVISQFDQAGTAIEGIGETAILTITFVTVAGGPPRYTHVVKVWPGGRVVDQQEATDAAKANAARFGIDVSQLQMVVASGVAPA